MFISNFLSTWTAVVNCNASLDFEPSEDLVITNASLAPEHVDPRTATSLQLTDYAPSRSSSTNGATMTICIATFTVNKLDQVSLFIPIKAGNRVTLEVIGPNAIHLYGFHLRAPIQPEFSNSAEREAEREMKSTDKLDSLSRTASPSKQKESLNVNTNRNADLPFSQATRKRNLDTAFSPEINSSPHPKSTPRVFSASSPKANSYPRTGSPSKPKAPFNLDASHKAESSLAQNTKKRDFDTAFSPESNPSPKSKWASQVVMASTSQPKIYKQTTTPGNFDEWRIIDGVEIKDISVGEGPIASKNTEVIVILTGRPKVGGNIFIDRHVKIHLGKKLGCQGLLTALTGMQKGGHRIARIPAALANVGEGSKLNVPPRTDVIFVCKVSDVINDIKKEGGEKAN